MATRTHGRTGAAGVTGQPFCRSATGQVCPVLWTPGHARPRYSNSVTKSAALTTCKVFLLGSEAEMVQLMAPDGKILLPVDGRLYPHRQFLQYHSKRICKWRNTARGIMPTGYPRGSSCGDS